ncbi:MULTISPECIES: hypothetical protein [unclassified Cellulophaga]|uniref:hypothetical protein n=1 Tax=unclassified Cellulophaga TaxID=2634405 RepID=UPI000C2C3972|nr:MULTISPECIES: hypothetical protein [unclassified Cellulophaga]MDO6490758.1 hypothetical protein [Cellulophaga sp. 2_MG-2023]MDO6494048.1 hypothetical protein [Cellulophaga sp. 3_MG-2023]PKB43938.1 hypothetical protein AX016_2148 [Cellulophaga sp. RHA19]
MKTVITLLFVIVLGLTAQAKETKTTPVLNVENTEVKTGEVKKEVIKKEVVKKKVEVVRLYMFKNAKIKRALAFTIKDVVTKTA